MNAPSATRGAALYLAVVQFLLATTWTIYVIYLPSLLESVGIPRSMSLWVLLLDQLTFTVTDFFLGFTADRVEKLVGRLGPAIVGVTAVSCLCFLAIPHLALGGGSSPLTTFLLFVALVLWVATSSALRAPTWVMIVKYAANPSIPWLAALVFVGVSVAAALSSYIGVALRNTDPRLPFAISSVTLFAVTVGMVWMERSLERSGRVEAPVSEKQRGLLAAPGSGLFLAGVVLLALGFQAHISFNSIPQYLRFATPADFDTLLPIFWVGFNILSLPAAALTPRWGGPRVLACAAVLGAVGTAIAATAPNLGMTILGQALAGGAWGSILTAGLSTALFLGRTGREGATSGLWFSTQSLAAALRIGIVVTQVDAAPEFSALSAWAPPLLWFVAAIVLAGAAWRAGAAEKASPTTA